MRGAMLFLPVGALAAGYGIYGQNGVKSSDDRSLMAMRSIPRVSHDNCLTLAKVMKGEILKVTEHTYNPTQIHGLTIAKEIDELGKIPLLRESNCLKSFPKEHFHFPAHPRDTYKDLPPLRAGSFSPYFSYTGSLVVTGAVEVTTAAGHGVQTVDVSLSGVDPACGNGAGEASNSCGIHIHSGSSCSADAGGHYYATTMSSNPWTSVAYKSAGGTAHHVLHVTTGLTQAQVTGKTFIVHAYDGSRIACGILA